MKKSDIQFWPVTICMLAAMIITAYFEESLKSFVLASISAGVGIALALGVGKLIKRFKARRGG